MEIMEEKVVKVYEEVVNFIAAGTTPGSAILGVFAT